TTTTPSSLPTPTNHRAMRPGNRSTSSRSCTTTNTKPATTKTGPTATRAASVPHLFASSFTMCQGLKQLLGELTKIRCLLIARFCMSYPPAYACASAGGFCVALGWGTSRVFLSGACRVLPLPLLTRARCAVALPCRPRCPVLPLLLRVPWPVVVLCRVFLGLWWLLVACWGWGGGLVAGGVGGRSGGGVALRVVAGFLVPSGCCGCCLRGGGGGVAVLHVIL